MKVINLEEDLPFVWEAIDNLKVELQIMRSNKEKWAIVIHGFGKRTQGGGKIRVEARKFLLCEKSVGMIKQVIFGEDFDIYSQLGLRLISQFQNLTAFVKTRNLGITIIEL